MKLYLLTLVGSPLSCDVPRASNLLGAELDTEVLMQDTCNKSVMLSLYVLVWTGNASMKLGTCSHIFTPIVQFFFGEGDDSKVVAM